MYRAGESPHTEHAASGLPSLTHLEEEVRFVQAQDQQVVTTRSVYSLDVECMYMLFTVDFS